MPFEFESLKSCSCCLLSNLDVCIRRCSSPMGAQRCSFHEHSYIPPFSSLVEPGVMGSTGRGWKCPWCGRRDNLTRRLTGYAFDGVGYAICISDDHSCASKLERGITRNGVRAGALFQIFKRNPRFEELFRVQPSLYLDISDFLHGMIEEPRSRPLLFRWNRLSSWTSYYCDDGTLIQYHRMLLEEMQDSRHIPATDLVYPHL